jgi:hypothetical protein
MRVIVPPHIDPEHPINTQEYAVYTPPIEEMVVQISDWINKKASGGYIYGASRFGKSRAIKWFVLSALEERFKSIAPLVVWIRRPDMHASEVEFWKDLLMASKFEFADPDKRIKNRTQARELFRHRMITLARAARSNYVVLLIDEAQGLTRREWNWLLGLQNVLDYDGYRLSVFSVGTQQIGYQHDFLAKTGDGHISARFLLLSAPFHGIRSREELEYVLNGYDQESEWPADSGISYLHYFAPKSYKAGKRLAHCADHIWQAMTELLPPGLKQPKTLAKIEFPMKFIALAVEDVLWRLAQDEEWEDVMNFDAWVETIASSGFTAHMQAIFNWC